MKDELLNPKTHQPGERWLVRFRSYERNVSEVTIVEYAPSGAFVKVRYRSGSESWLDEMPIAVEKLADAAPSLLRISGPSYASLNIPCGTGSAPLKSDVTVTYANGEGQG